LTVASGLSSSPTRRALRRLATEAWPLLHSALAVTVAWAIARHVIHHHQPFFAPVAAMAALNAALGERGLNALRMLLGVALGIVTAEIAIVLLGGGYATMALATFTAMTAAVAFGGIRIVIAEAAASTILTVALASGEVGIQRLEDAAIGGVVALVFSQLLFAPEPVALVRRAEAAALTEMAIGVRLTADMLDRDDDALGDQAVAQLRELRGHLAELIRTTQASTKVARHSAPWRSRMARVVRENENAGHLDLLGGTCLLLARTAITVNPPQRRPLAPIVRELSEALAGLAAAPGDRSKRQDAVDRALHAVRRAEGVDAAPDAPRAATLMAVRLVAGDIMSFAGAAPLHPAATLPD
jgi:uncharacterized membrane protein YgaE (UPF0421/DUF939 family)